MPPHTKSKISLYLQLVIQEEVPQLLATETEAVTPAVALNSYNRMSVLSYMRIGAFL